MTTTTDFASKFQPAAGDVSTEFEHADSVHRYNGCSGPCPVCDEADNLRCSNGEDCCTIGGCPIGGWLDEHPDTGHPVGRYTTPWVFASIPGAMFCEDCAIELETVGK